jgi:CBS domain containing-hemolysin-like protein
VIPLLLGVVLLAANGFFVAAEFATIAARQTKLEMMAEAGSRRAAVALGATRHIQLQLAGAQLGITMASLGLGSVFEPFVDRHLHRATGAIPGIPEGVATPIAFALSLLFVVFLHMVFGELVPKNLAISAPEATLLGVAVPYRAFLAAFRPVLLVLSAIAGAGVRLFGVQPRTEVPRAHSPSDIAAMVDASKEEGLIEEFAHGLLAGVLDLRDRTAADVMVPWDAVVLVPAGATVAEVERLAAQVGHSRLPVASASGPPTRFVHIKDLLQVPLARREQPVPVNLVRSVLRCRPGDPLDGLLRSMRRSRVHVAIVVSGTGVPVGLVTLEDVLEELVGEIRDESDPVPPEEDSAAPSPGAVGMAAAPAPGGDAEDG